MRKIYYYSRRFPEFGIKSFDVLDELYLIGKEVKALEYVVANYDIERDIQDDERWISVYSPFDDDELFAHDSAHSTYGCDYILSFNKDKLYDRYKESYLYQKDNLKKRLERFNENIVA